MVLNLFLGYSKAMTTTIELADLPQLSQISDLAHSIWRDYYLGIISRPQIEFMLAADYSLDQLEKDRATGTNFLILKENGQAIGFAAFHTLNPSVVNSTSSTLRPNTIAKATGSVCCRQQNARQPKAGQACSY